MAELQDHLIEYRKFLQAAEQKAQEDFDKTVLSLSGGALGISFVFLKDVLGSKPVEVPRLLLGSWVCWGASALSVLISFYLSHLALREAIRQVDAGEIDGRRPGGQYALATEMFNALGASLFFIGVLCITAFAGFNLSKIGAANGQPQSTAAPASAPTAAAAPTSTIPATGTQARPSN
jgi:hypothetical protein